MGGGAGQQQGNSPGSLTADPPESSAFLSLVCPSNCIVACSLKPSCLGIPGSTPEGLQSTDGKDPGPSPLIPTQVLRMTHKKLWFPHSFIQQTSPEPCSGPGPVLETFHLGQSFSPTYLSHNPVGTPSERDASPDQAEPATETAATAF